MRHARCDWDAASTLSNRQLPIANCALSAFVRKASLGEERSTFDVRQSKGIISRMSRYRMSRTSGDGVTRSCW